MSAAEVDAARRDGRLRETEDSIGFHLTDAPPAASAPSPAPSRGDDKSFSAMSEALDKGVKAIAVPQLFETPSDLARRLANEAGLLAGRRILEPSAGTGNLIRAALGAATGADCCQIVAVERNVALAQSLIDQRNRTVHATERNFRVVCGDFLEIDGPQALTADVPEPSPLGLFDAVLMNPPFEKQADIRHVRHALRFLKPGGRLVAIMSAGVTYRQDRVASEFRALVEERGGVIEPLPDDAFKGAGTSVRTVLVTLDA
jgi:predicted RNA methylase